MAMALNNMSLLKDGLLVRVASKIPGIASVSAGGAITTSTTLALLRVWPAIGIPLSMWLKFLKDQVKTEQVWEDIGKLTAVRQWLRQLELLTFSRENDFPDEVSIDLDYISAEPYFVGRYFKEQLDEYGLYSQFIFAPDRMKKGFDDGAKLMEDAGREILSKVDEMIEEVFRSWKLDSCKIQVLNDAGILSLKSIKAHAVRQLTRILLDKLPKV
jgi:hypothetical protein